MGNCTCLQTSNDQSINIGELSNEPDPSDTIRNFKSGFNHSNINIESQLPETLISKDGEIQTQSILNADLICFYFSASWSASCKKFTPLLAETYHIWKKKGKSIEIVFVSSDKTDSDFSEYYNIMPWLALCRNEMKVKEQLVKKFSVFGFPKLVVCDKEGNVIDSNARFTVQKFNTDSYDAWCKNI